MTRSNTTRPSATSTCPLSPLPLEAGTTTLVTYLPEPSTPAHEALALLASWTASETEPSSTTPARQPRS